MWFVGGVGFVGDFIVFDIGVVVVVVYYDLL